MRFYAWWSGMPRQGRTGWTLVVVGTVNIRMAEMRERRQGTLPLIDPNLRSRK